MTPNTPMYASDMIKVEVIITSGFVATELAAVMDVCRIANRLAVRPVFDLRIACPAACAHPVSLGGLAVAADPLITEEGSLPDILIVAGGAGCSKPNAALSVRAQKVMRRGGRVLLLSDATTALLRGHAPEPVVVHWETEAVLAERGLSAPMITRLYLKTGRLITCAGMTATYDAMLAIVEESFSPMLADDVARVLLLDRRRSGKNEQPRGQSDSPGLSDGPLKRALQMMEASIDSAIPTREMCRTIGISSRQLERIFACTFGLSPQRYHRALRLHRARLLIESSHLPLFEISVACGFGTHSHFSRQFRKEFGISPRVLRRQIKDRKAGSHFEAHDGFVAPNVSPVRGSYTPPRSSHHCSLAPPQERLSRFGLCQTGN